MSEVAEFQNATSAYRRTLPTSDPEKAEIADGSRTLRRKRGAHLDDLAVFRDMGISRVFWSAGADWKGVGTSRVRVSETINELLRGYYELRRADETSKFIDRHEFLFPWLMVLYPRVKAHFPGSRLYLEAVSDPEVNDVRLIVSAKVDTDPGNAIEKLNAFDSKWSNLVTRAVDQVMTVTVEF